MSYDTDEQVRPRSIPVISLILLALSLGRDGKGQESPDEPSRA